jgi:hypothetical protein
MANREGKGTVVWENGAKYTGTLKNDNPHGKGEYLWPYGK